MIPVMKYKLLTFIFSGAIFLASVYSLFAFGLKPGIEFTGGSLVEVSFAGKRPEIAEIQKALEPIKLGDVIAQKAGEKSVILKTRYITETEHQDMLSVLRKTFGGQKEEVAVQVEGGVIFGSKGASKDGKPMVTEDRVETIGPSISANLKSRAFGAILIVSLTIIAYIAYAFRGVSKPLASWKYGVAGVVALVHDVVITMGIFALLGHYYGIEVDIPFVVALMTIFGYSIHDTIVVFDRVRENLVRYRGHSFTEIVNIGINETMARSINTSVATLLSLFALYFVGGQSIHNFALALIIGISFGTYSSVFVASAILVAWEEYRQRKRESIA